MLALPLICKLKHAARIYMYADDHHPPHFHLIRAGVECLVRLSDLQVIEGEIDRRDYAEAVEWAAENMDVLQRKWSELNERDR